MKRRIQFAVPLSVLLIVSACQHEQEPAEARSLPAASVRTAAVQARPFQATEEVVGTVRSKTRAVIESRVGGRIERLAVSPGQKVVQGDLIAQLDVREIQARLDQAKAALEQANRDLERYTTLLQQNVLTRAEYDTAEARQRIARASVTEAETMLSYARVTAPFDGVVTRKLSDVGDIAAPGRGIVELEDPLALRVESGHHWSSWTCRPARACDSASLCAWPCPWARNPRSAFRNPPWSGAGKWKWSLWTPALLRTCGW
jgi:membrane fusion protein (multidrug efflux system)